MSDTKRGPGVKFPPPFFFLLAALAAWQLNKWWRLPVMPTSSDITVALGWAMLVAGFLLALWGIVTFRRAGTALAPIRPASKIVDSGPYRFTRNPMYLGMTTMLIGGGVLANNLWMLLFTPVVLLLIVRFVIRREEAYLSEAFPAEYASYRARVRRFL